MPCRMHVHGVLDNSKEYLADGPWWDRETWHKNVPTNVAFLKHIRPGKFECFFGSELDPSGGHLIVDDA